MKISFLSLAAATLLLSFPTVHGSVPGDEHWDSQFGLVGTSDRLQAISIFNNKIYVGSVFFAAGNTKANSVAGYDGTNWFRLNNGVSPPNNAFVYDLANDGTNLYLAGSFTNVDNSGARGIARWDGNNWWPLAGGNPNSLAACIKIVGTNFFVGGAFTTNGGVTVNGIARWDGSGWHALGSGVAGGTPGTYVLAMESDGTNLYVGGSFTQAGGITASNVARWNGSTWSAMGNGFATGFSGGIYALQKFGNDIYIGGSFTNSPLGIYNFARWDGAAWSPVGTGANGAVRCFLVVGSNLYVGGDFSQINGVAANRIAKWDGTTWSPLGSGIQGYGAGSGLGIYKMALDNQGRLIAAGNMSQAGGVGVSHIAGWDGTNWFALGGTTSKGLSHFIGMAQGLYCDGTNLFAGGFFTEGGATIVNGTARWDGTNWYSLGPVVNGQLPSFQSRAFTRGGGYLYAGGSFTNIGGVAAAKIARWDGTNWSNIGDADAEVRALAYDYNNFVWAGGIFTNIGGITSTGLSTYIPGSGWANIGSVSGGSHLVNAIVSDGTSLYVGGNFTSIEGVSATNIARFYLAGWSALGNGVNGTVNALAAANGVVYAGGTFTSASGVPVSRIAKWDGSSWSSLGTGMTNTATPSVSSLALRGTDLYAGGAFTNAGGVVAYGIAKWNGTSWTNLGSGLFYSYYGTPGSGSALAIKGNDVFVAGTLTLAGDKPSLYIGRWNDQSNFYPTPHPQLTRTAWVTNSPGQMQFRLIGTSGESYVIQASTNLEVWTPLLTNSTTLYDFIDTNAPRFPSRFYRVILP